MKSFLLVLALTAPASSLAAPIAPITSSYTETTNTGQIRIRPW